MTLRIEDADRAALAVIHALFREYAAWLNIDLEFQNFERELADLPGAYAPPHGALLLAWVDESVAGCVAMRPLEAEICEMKRLWVRPDFRGCGIGEALARAIMLKAARAGYARMRLDTLPAMKKAQAIYATLGFRPIAPYYRNPDACTVYLEAELEGIAEQPSG
jgi:ribosomal protein S18 acetylase RimI-like enzyme